AGPARLGCRRCRRPDRRRHCRRRDRRQPPLPLLLRPGLCRGTASRLLLAAPALLGRLCLERSSGAGLQLRMAQVAFEKPGFGRAFLLAPDLSENRCTLFRIMRFYFEALIARSTASLGQQSSFNPAFF